MVSSGFALNNVIAALTAIDFCLGLNLLTFSVLPSVLRNAAFCFVKDRLLYGKRRQIAARNAAFRKP